MYYTIYKITNKINNKIYIGCHKTIDLTDDYMGSGKILKRSIEKYGIDNFTKKYLHIFDNSDDMFNMESTLVNEDFVNENTNYNLRIGGLGGFDYINENKLNVYPNAGKMGFGGENLVHGTQLKDLLIKRGKYDKWKENISKTLKKSFKDGLIKPSFLGKKHSKETLKKMSNSHKKIDNKGKKNPAYGKMWIHNKELKLNKMIIKTDIFPDGWDKGSKREFYGNKPE